MRSSRSPSLLRAGVVTLVAIFGSLAADAGLVKLGVAWSPAIRAYSHFRLSDYGTLTVVGVLAACASWPLVIRISSTPRWLFFRLAVVLTLVLWIPDVWLLAKGEPARAVLVLIAMHLAIALITYNLLVFATPVRPDLASVPLVPNRSSLTKPHLVVDEVTMETDGKRASRARRARAAMTWAVTVEFVTGLLAVVYVPFGRPNGWIAQRGEVLYVVHTVIGGLLGLGAIVVLVSTSRVSSKERKSAVVGACGVALGAIGGMVCVDSSLRLYGVLLMLIGVIVAFVGYLSPNLVDSSTPPPGWNVNRDE